MIAYLQGKLTIKDPTYIVVEVNGVGYQVKISLHTFSQLKQTDEARVHTHLLVREDAHTLYGFATEEERKCFLWLISVNGVGPNIAIMALSSLTVADLKNAILSEDVRTIQAVKGIGAKTAQRVILELRDKIGKDTTLSPDNQNSAAAGHNTIRDEALAALVTLGFAKAAAEKSVSTILKKADDSITLEEVIKSALQSA